LKIAVAAGPPLDLSWKVNVKSSVLPQTGMIFNKHDDRIGPKQKMAGS